MGDSARAFRPGSTLRPGLLWYRVAQPGLPGLVAWSGVAYGDSWSCFPTMECRQPEPGGLSLASLVYIVGTQLGGTQLVAFVLLEGVYRAPVARWPGGLYALRPCLVYAVGTQLVAFLPSADVRASGSAGPGVLVPWSWRPGSGVFVWIRLFYRPFRQHRPKIKAMFFVQI